MKKGNLKLMQGDCMDVMMGYPDGYFDWGIVDPPYFEEYAKQNYTGNSVSATGVKRQSKKINNWGVPDEEYFSELFRVSKNQIIWGCNYYASFIPSTGRIIWDKINDSSSFSKCEIASHSLGCRVDQFRYKWNGMIQADMKYKEKRIHPTQKPIGLYSWTYENYASKGDKVLDTHLGSGSNAIAAHYFGVGEFVGVELDKDHYKATCKRVKEQTKQLRLAL